MSKFELKEYLFFLEDAVLNQNSGAYLELAAYHEREHPIVAKYMRQKAENQIKDKNDVDEPVLLLLKKLSDKAASKLLSEKDFEVFIDLLRKTLSIHDPDGYLYLAIYYGVECPLLAEQMIKSAISTIEYQEWERNENNIEVLTVRAEQQDATALYKLGMHYSIGDCFAPDDKKAAELFEKAAAQNYAPAFHEAGRAYEFGFGVPEDIEKARMYYQKGAELGNKFCKMSLERL